MIKRYHVSLNLWDEVYTDIGSVITYKSLNVGEGTFTISTNMPKSGDVTSLFFLPGAVTTGAASGTNGVWDTKPITVSSIDGYVTIAYRKGIEYYNPEDYHTMLNSGSTPLPYDPYSADVWHDIPLKVYDISGDTWTESTEKQYSNGSWGTVTSNAKVLRRKRTTKRKT